MSSYTYRKLSLLGSGVYGKVYKAERETDGKFYAIKANVGNSTIDGMISLADLNLTHCINCHPCFVPMDWVSKIPFKEKLEQISPTSHSNRYNLRYDNIFFIMEIAETALSNLFYQERINDLVPNIRKFIAEILLGLEFLHANRYCHRDIKANNILIFYDENGSPHAKIADYGFAHYLGKERNTIEIQNYTYRAPEIAARCSHYTSAIDIWSTGILLYEMLTLGKSPYPGKEPARMSDIKVLERIHQAFDLQDVEYPNVSKEFIAGITYVSSIKSFDRSLQNNLLPQVIQKYPQHHFSDLLKNMLNVRIEKRYTATQCLNHPFFTEDAETNELIKRYRAQFNIKPDGSISSSRNYIVVTDSPVRKMMFKYADDVKAIAPEYFRWFTYQIWFATIDLFDRWLVWTLENSEKQLEDTDIFVAYYTCLYIMLKTCSTRKNISFNNLHSQLKYHKETFRELEKTIVNDITAGHIFRPTIFDELPSFDPDEDFKQLRKLVLPQLPKYNGERWKKLANSYVAHKRKKVEKVDVPVKLPDQN